MTEENEDIKLKNSILDKIKSDNIQMTPKQFFFMKWLTLFTTSVFFLILGIYIFAYIVFLFVDNGLMYIPLLTATGIADFIIEIPWTLVFLGILSIFLFSITSKTFYRIYRKPFLTFFFSILMIIVISHVIFVETGGMKYLKEEAYKGNFHLVPEKFLQFRDSQSGSIFVGYVVGTTTNSLIIRDRKNNIIELFSKESINYNTFSLGQLINAYGQKENGQVYVKSIEIIN